MPERIMKYSAIYVFREGPFRDTYFCNYILLQISWTVNMIYEKIVKFGQIFIHQWLL